MNHYKTFIAALFMTLTTTALLGLCIGASHLHGEVFGMVLFTVACFGTYKCRVIAHSGLLAWVISGNQGHPALGHYTRSREAMEKARKSSNLSVVFYATVEAVMYYSVVTWIGLVWGAVWVLGMALLPAMVPLFHRVKTRTA